MGNLCNGCYANDIVSLCHGGVAIVKMGEKTKDGPKDKHVLRTIYPLFDTIFKYDLMLVTEILCHYSMEIVIYLLRYLASKIFISYITFNSLATSAVC